MSYLESLREARFAKIIERQRKLAPVAGSRVRLYDNVSGSSFGDEYVVSSVGDREIWLTRDVHRVRVSLCDERNIFDGRNVRLSRFFNQ